MDKSTHATVRSGDETDVAVWRRRYYELLNQHIALLQKINEDHLDATGAERRTATDAAAQESVGLAV